MAIPQFIAPPAFQFYASDFLGSSRVARMSNTEIGIYTLLLCHAWTNNGLPLSMKERALMARTPAARFERLWQGALSECWEKRGDRYVNPRQEEIRNAVIAFRRRQSDNGQKGGRPKKPDETQPITQKKPTGKPKRNPEESSPISDLPSTDVSKEQKHPVAHPVRAFLELYETLFEAQFNAKPVIMPGRDPKIAKDAIDRFTEEKAQTLLRAFFASDDPFIQKSGYGLNIFAGQLNKLLVGDRGPATGNPRTAGNFAALKAFANRGSRES